MKIESVPTCTTVPVTTCPGRRRVLVRALSLPWACWNMEAKSLLTAVSFGVAGKRRRGPGKGGNLHDERLLG